MFPWFWTVSDHMIPQAVETLVAPALLLDFDHRLLYSKPLLELVALQYTYSIYPNITYNLIKASTRILSGIASRKLRI